MDLAPLLLEDNWHLTQKGFKTLFSSIEPHFEGYVNDLMGNDYLASLSLECGSSFDSWVDDLRWLQTVDFVKGLSLDERIALYRREYIDIDWSRPSEKFPGKFVDLLIEMGELTDIRDIKFEHFRMFGADTYVKNAYGGLYNALNYGHVLYNWEDGIQHSISSEFKFDKPYIWEFKYLRKIQHADTDSKRRAVIQWISWKHGLPVHSIPWEIYSKFINFEGSYFDLLMSLHLLPSPETIYKYSKMGYFPEDVPYPWESTTRVPSRLYNPRMIRAIVRWLSYKTRKPITSLTRVDFENYGLNSLLRSHNSSVYQILVHARLAYGPTIIKKYSETARMGRDRLYPWELSQTPKFVYDDPLLVRAMILWVADKKLMPYYKLSSKDFKEFGIYYRSRGIKSLHDFYVFAGLAYDLDTAYQHALFKSFKDDLMYPWEFNMLSVPKSDPRYLYSLREWIAWVLGIPSHEVKYGHFRKLGHGGIYMRFRDYYESDDTAVAVAV